MARNSVRVEGLSDLKRSLKKLSDHTQGRALGDATLAAAKPIRDEAKALAPRSDSPSGSRGKGHAADHIRAELDDVKSGRTRAEVNVGPKKDFFYLIFAELGTPSQPAIAPFRRAADAKFREAVREFREQLKAEIAVAVK